MLDGIGNKLVPGSLLYWGEKKMVFLVANVHDGGKGDGPHVTLQITIPVKWMEPGEPRLVDFFALQNPASALLLDGILDKGTGKGPARKQ